MRKLSILFISAFVLLSCQKESTLPAEYNYLIGNWSLDSYVITYNPTSPNAYKDTFPADSIGYNIQYSFDMFGFTEYIENTKVVESTFIESIDVNIVNDTSGNNGVGYYIIYRTCEPGISYALSFGLDYTHSILKQSYVSDYSNYTSRYLFVFKRD